MNAAFFRHFFLTFSLWSILFLLYTFYVFTHMLLLRMCYCANIRNYLFKYPLKRTIVIIITLKTKGLLYISAFYRCSIVSTKILFKVLPAQNFVCNHFVYYIIKFAELQIITKAPNIFFPYSLHYILPLIFCHCEFLRLW